MARRNVSEDFGGITKELKRSMDSRITAREPATTPCGNTSATAYAQDPTDSEGKG